MSKFPVLLTMPRLNYRPLFSFLRTYSVPPSHRTPPFPFHATAISKSTSALYPPRHFSALSVAMAAISNPMPRLSKKARRESPEFVLKAKLDLCSKHNNLSEALSLYRAAKVDGTPLSIQHYNALLYVCSLNAGSDDGVDSACGVSGLEMGFELFRKMSVDGVEPNEATFLSLARLAAAKNDPDMAFGVVKKMKASGLVPKLRSYGPALFGFCEKGDADKAFEVDAHMVECGIVAEEAELAALLKVSVEVNRGDKVYEILHRLRGTVRQVLEETSRVLEGWFVSETASDVGVENWDVEKVKEGVLRGGGGWHGQGWLGSGKWNVVKSVVDKSGLCSSCGEKLVCIDIDPKETEGFAGSLSSLAYQKEKRANFSQFQEWLKTHGPFDAVIDGANVGLINSQTFSFRQLNDVVNQLRQLSPSKRLPLVILHRGRVFGGPAENPNTKKMLDSWRQAGALYATPQGSNDDWYWMYAAVSNKCLLVTNDEMRDHLFQLLGNIIFPRWKEKHQVRMTVSRKGLELHMPPPYSIVIQESDRGSWHVPTVVEDDLQTPRQWLCASRVSRTTSSVRPRLSNIFAPG